MTILGVDPGSTETAWCVYGGGKVLSHAKEDNEALRKALRDGVTVDSVAIEMMASYGMAVGAEVFQTCLWIGRFLEILEGRVPVRLVYRKDVKMHLCGSMRAKDANIRAALIDKLGPPGTKKNQGVTYGISGDCWSALAIAVTADETT